MGLFHQNELIQENNLQITTIPSAIYDSEPGTQPALRLKLFAAPRSGKVWFEANPNEMHDFTLGHVNMRT